LSYPRVALVHDRLNVMAGSEKVLKALHELFPDAPIFTAVSDPKLIDKYFPGARVNVSFLQKFPFVTKHHQKFLPLFMMAFEQFDLSAFDLIISSSHCAAKSVITKPNACHICYCHSPMRYAWDLYNEYSRHQGRLTRTLWGAMANYVRVWDYSSAARVDYFVANSSYIARRIRKCYGRDSAVIHPPVAIEKFHRSHAVDDYYLIVSRFASYKGVDLAIEAFNRIQRRLVLIGAGEQESYLRRIAGPTIEFKGRLSDKEMAEHMSRSKGLIHAAEEDFGINMVESLASGRPVIAYGVGGSKDIIEPGVNGVLFGELSVDSLIDAVRKCDSANWDTDDIRQSSLKFSTERFKEEISSLIEWARNDFDREKPYASSWKYQSTTDKSLEGLQI